MTVRNIVKEIFAHRHAPLAGAEKNTSVMRYRICFILQASRLNAVDTGTGENEKCSEIALTWRGNSCNEHPNWTRHSKIVRIRRDIDIMGKYISEHSFHIFRAYPPDTIENNVENARQILELRSVRLAASGR